MALERVDRVKETTTTTGTGTLNLAGAVTGYQAFVDGVTSGATVRYYIEMEDLSEWEVGEGVFTDATPDTLSRVTVYASSNSGSLVNFSAGTKNVALSLTAIDIDDMSLKAPQGFLINGKIVPSVTSNNLTVAIKGLDGNDPSATNPIYCRIGDTVRTITSALSVTTNAGTNWFNSGSSELATKEVDYFVYIGYNATDGVTIGFSRIPCARQYGDFSATSTNEKYAAISTITNAASTDYYEVVGRFASTLSAGAGYTWTVPTFTAINLIQSPIYETRLLDWVPTLTAGADLSGYDVAKYSIKCNSLYIIFNANAKNVTTAGVVNVSLPITAISAYSQFSSQIYDASAWSLAAIYLDSGTPNVAVVYKSMTRGNWAGTENGVYIWFNGILEI